MEQVDFFNDIAVLYTLWNLWFDNTFFLVIWSFFLEAVAQRCTVKKVL